MDCNSSFQDQDDSEIYIYIYIYTHIHMRINMHIYIYLFIYLYTRCSLNLSFFNQLYHRQRFRKCWRDILQTKFSQFWLRSQKEQKVTRGQIKRVRGNGLTNNTRPFSGHKLPLLLLIGQQQKHTFRGHPLHFQVLPYNPLTYSIEEAQPARYVEDGFPLSCVDEFANPSVFSFVQLEEVRLIILS